MSKRGRPALPDGLARQVFDLVEAQIKAGKHPSVTETCAALAEIVGRPGGTLADAPNMDLWRILSCAGSNDWRSVKTWEAMYRAGRAQAGLPALPAGRKRKG
jgi:hypothetical protein